MNVTTLVSTFDGWSLLWKPFAHAWTTFFPNCPWPTYFITNEMDAPLDGAIKTGLDINWTNMTRAALSQIDTDIVLFVHDDCWLTHPVDTNTLLQFLSTIERDEADIVKLYRSDPRDQGGRGEYESDRRLYWVDLAFPYAISLQASFWKKSLLQSLLHEDESCWYFETTGTGRVRAMNPLPKILCINEDHTPAQYESQSYFCYLNAAAQGQWRLNLRGDTILGDKVEDSSSVPSELRKEINYAPIP